MSDTLKVHGTPAPKGTSWLNEVKVDAARNAVQHLKNQKERDEFQAAKARGITPGEILEQGKQDLGLVSDEPEENESLQTMNKKQLLALANEKGVTVEDGMTKAQLVEALAEEENE